jgi:hypothetical protein
MLVTLYINVNKLTSFVSERKYASRESAKTLYKSAEMSLAYSVCKECCNSDKPT